MAATSSICVQITLHNGTFYVQKAGEGFQPFGSISSIPADASDEAIGALIASHLDPLWRIISPNESLRDLLAANGDHINSESILIDIERTDAFISLDAMPCFPANELGLTAHLMSGRRPNQLAESLRLVCRGAEAYRAAGL